MVIEVLRFARRHKYPLLRSAFTYCDDDRTSRLDYAKARYGGPFTTEQVEDVKIFVRILILLISLGPIFIMEVQTGITGFMVFGLHTGYPVDYANRCTVWVLLESGALMHVLGSIFLPVYMYIYFILLRHTTSSKMFNRLRVGIILWILGTLSMLAIDLAGHLHSVNDSGLGSHCMFAYSRNDSKYELMYPVLEMHWAVLIPPNILLGIGPPIVTATVFEFISAQSPHSMKGLLIGVFFAIRGVFQLIGSLVLLPFSSDAIWSKGYMRDHPPVTNCGFGYLLFISVVALVGFSLFSVVAKRYKYRERDDKPYDYTMVEEVFDRRNRMRQPTPDGDVTDD